MEVLRGLKAEPGKSRFGRTLVLAIPVAATCGGFMTPVGSSNTGHQPLSSGYRPKRGLFPLDGCVRALVPLFRTE
jgi:hypothetical protein